MREVIMLGVILFCIALMLFMHYNHLAVTVTQSMNVWKEKHKPLLFDVGLHKDVKRRPYQCELLDWQQSLSAELRSHKRNGCLIATTFNNLNTNEWVMLAWYVEDNESAQNLTQTEVTILLTLLIKDAYEVDKVTITDIELIHGSYELPRAVFV